MVFVTGKGGVGKSTVAAALGLAGARRRRRAIVCELGARGQLARAFGRAPPRPGAELELAPGLCSVGIDPNAALEEWMARNIGRPGAALLARSDSFRYFVAAAPGARELISMGKAWDLTRGRGDGRLVIVDAPSTGHAVGLLQAPTTFSRLGGVGPIGHEAAHIRDFLADPSSTAIALVCTPSEMPVTETVELAAAIEEVTGRPPDAVIANQVLPDRFDTDEIELIDRGLDASDDPRLHAARRAVAAGARAGAPARPAARRARGTHRRAALPLRRGARTPRASHPGHGAHTVAHLSSPPCQPQPARWAPSRRRTCSRTCPRAPTSSSRWSTASRLRSSMRSRPTTSASRTCALHQMHALYDRPYIHGAYAPRLRHVSYFLAAATREAYWNGRLRPRPQPFLRDPGAAALEHALLDW